MVGIVPTGKKMALVVWSMKILTRLLNVMMPGIFGVRRPDKGIITVNCKTGRATDQVRRITSKYRVDFSFVI